MFGILDIVMSVSNGVDTKEEKHADKFVKYMLDRGSDVTWVCFLPRRTTLEIAQKYNLLPKKDNLIAYEVPLNMISDNPYVTRKAFFSLIEDFEKVYSEQLSGKIISFAGISVGSMPALFLANRYTSQKVRIICSTNKLGEGIFSAFAARKIKKAVIENGFNAETYDKVLAEINPINNISHLSEDVSIVISRFDKYIPYKGGDDLVKIFRKKQKKVKIYKFYFFGHFLTMLAVGWINRKGDFF